MNQFDKKPEFIKRDSSIMGEDYARLLTAIKEKFKKSQIKAATKINTALLEFYWEMGREISKLSCRNKYGSAFFECLSLDLKAAFPGQTGFSSTNIKYIKRWYEFFSHGTINRHQVGDDSEMPVEFGLVPWKHHVHIFTHSHSVSQALFYIDKTIENGWSRSELESEMDANLYQRQGNAITNFREKLPKPYGGLAEAILKSPYDFGFLDKKVVCEKQLEDELAKNITRFLLELGQGFAYVGRQIELKMPGGQTFIPDMIFYHTRLKCYIVCELKVSEFIPEYAGKLNFYVSAVDELMRQPDDNLTIGLLICKAKDNTIVEWSFRGITQPLGVAEYKLRNFISEKASQLLPSESEIQKMIDFYDED